MSTVRASSVREIDYPEAGAVTIAGPSWARNLVPLGRLLFSLIFIMSSFNHFSAGTIEYARSAGVPAPEVAVPVSGVIALIGGLSLLLGFRARFGAWMLVLFLVPVTLMMHNFWAIPDPAQAQMQQIHFMKNLAMVGGALLVTWFGAGPVSMDARRASTIVLQKGR